jgi:hypothetical protein
MVVLLLVVSIAAMLDREFDNQTPDKYIDKKNYTLFEVEVPRLPYSCFLVEGRMDGTQLKG